MNDSSPGAMFSVPYEIAVARPLRQTSRAERAAALRAAHYNTELLPQELIYIDLSTDSGVSSLSTRQLALSAAANSVEPGMGLAAEGSRAFALLAEQIQGNFGFPFFVPTTQGRSAERIWSKLHVKPGSLVAGNMLFPSTRMHLEMNGAKIVDVIGDVAHDLTSEFRSKAISILKNFAQRSTEHGAEKISCIYVELSVNSCGGHPVSLVNLRLVKITNKAPTAAFSASVTTGKAPLRVDLTDKSSDPDGIIAARCWEFGDDSVKGGCDSTETNPSHVFTKAGTYAIRLVTTDEHGASSAKAASVKITVRR